MSAEPADIEAEELIEGRKEISQLEELIGFLNDAAMDMQGIATNEIQYLDDKNTFTEQLALLSPSNNLLYDISQIKRSFIVLENVLYPRIKVNPNFKEVSEILRNQGYKSNSKKDSVDVADTNAGYCKRMALIDISSNLYGVVASLQLLLEKIKAAEIVSVGITDISIENTAKGIAAAQGLGVYEKYKEPLSEALNKMWRLHGRTEQWQNIAPVWESMNQRLDLIAAGEIYKFSLRHYETFEERYDDLHTFENDKRGFATLRGVLNIVDKFVRNYKVEL